MAEQSLVSKNWRDLIKPRRLDVDAETLTGTYGKFVAEPLERGFGTTLGNSLRRVLLSSLQGAAITTVKIEGNGGLRTVSVGNVGERSSPEGWGEFTRRLRRAVRGLRVRRSPWGMLFGCLGCGLLVAATWLAVGPSWWPLFADWSPSEKPAPPPSSAPSPSSMPPPGATDASPSRSVGA